MVSLIDMHRRAHFIVRKKAVVLNVFLHYGVKTVSI